MGKGVPREAEWGIGIAFIVGMVVLLILAIQSFEGSTAIILIVVAAVFLLVGLFFLTGADRAGEGRASNGASPPAEGAPGSGARFAKAGAGVPSLVVCPNCGSRVADTFETCPNCGARI